MKDPRTSVSDKDLESQFDFLIKVRDRLSEAHAGVNQILSVKKEVLAVFEEAESQEEKAKVIRDGEALIEKLTSVLDQLVELRFRGLDDQMLVYPLRLNNMIASLQGVAVSADRRPTKQTLEYFDELSAELDSHIAALKKIMENDVPVFMDLVKD